MATIKSLYEAESSLVAWYSCVDSGTGATLQNELGVSPDYDAIPSDAGMLTDSGPGPFTGESVLKFNADDQYWAQIPGAIGNALHGATGVTYCCWFRTRPSDGGLTNRTVLYSRWNNNFIGQSLRTRHPAGDDGVKGGARWEETGSFGESAYVSYTEATWVFAAVVADLTADTVSVKVNTGAFDTDTAVGLPSTVDGTNFDGIYIARNGPAGSNWFMGNTTLDAEADETGGICYIAIFAEALSSAALDTFANATAGIEDRRLPAIPIPFTIGQPPSSDPFPAIAIPFTPTTPAPFASPGTPASLPIPFTLQTPSLGTVSPGIPSALSIPFTIRQPTRPIVSPQIAVRAYRLKIEIVGESPDSIQYTVPVNWQARYAYDRANYLSVSLHNISATLLEALTDALGQSPDAATVYLSIQSGFRFADGFAFYADLMRSVLQDAQNVTGPRSSSAVLSGYLDDTTGDNPKAVTLGSANTIRQGSVARGWIGPLDDNVAPGDQVTISDTGEVWVVGNITYRVDARSAIMEVSELTDADLLAELPW